MSLQIRAYGAAYECYNETKIEEVIETFKG